MDAFQRVRRFLPTRVSNRRPFSMPSEISETQWVRADWRDLPRASAADRLAFYTILVGFAIVFVPALIITGAAMVLVRVFSLIGSAFRGRR
jgi:hypothetical protein